jgi:translation initiation factor 6
MAILKDNVYGGSNIGVFMALSNKVFLYPHKANPKLVDFVIQSTPNVIPIEVFLHGASVLGVYTAMNSHGMIIPSLVTDEELAIIKNAVPQDFRITQIDSEDNTFGNLILCNDKGAIVSPLLLDAKEIIQETLQVPVSVFHFAKSKLPGSCGLVNNFGGVIHPLSTEEEADQIASALKVEIDVSTINCGNPFLHGGAIVNDKMGLFGRSTTGPEISRICEMLKLE